MEREPSGVGLHDQEREHDDAGRRGPAQADIGNALQAAFPSHEMSGHRGRDHEGRIDRREPVRFDPRMQGVPDEIGGDGPEGRIDEHASGLRTGLEAGKRMQPHRAENKDQRRCEGDLRRHQFEQIVGAKILDPGAAADLLEERDPVVLGVPDQHRRKDRKGEKPAEIGPWREQPGALLRHNQEPDQDRRPEEQRAVFRQQRKADRGADRKPPRPSGGFQHLGERKQHETCGNQQRRVRRHDQRADGRHQRDIEQDRRGCRHPHAAEQDRGRAIHRVAHRQREQDRDQPDAEGRIARDVSTGADHQRDHRRMIVIAPGQRLRPHPVIGFVEGQRRDRGGHQPQHHECYDRQPGVADETRIGSRHRAPTACARRTGPTWRSSRPRPSARRPRPPATRSAPGRRPRTPRRHWRTGRRCRRGRR